MRLAIAVTGLTSAAVVVYLAAQRARRRARERVCQQLNAIMSHRAEVPKGKVASETDDARIDLPAILGASGRILLGDYGHLEMLLEDEGTDRFRRYLLAHPIKSILVCMGSAAAAAVARELDKRKLAYKGLDGCVDEVGYPIIDLHLSTARAFIRDQLAATNPHGCILVHCKEGKNRSAALCAAYLMVEERMLLTQAIKVHKLPLSRVSPSTCATRFLLNGLVHLIAPCSTYGSSARSCWTTSHSYHSLSTSLRLRDSLVDARAPICISGHLVDASLATALKCYSSVAFPAF